MHGLREDTCARRTRGDRRRWTSGSVLHATAGAALFAGILGTGAPMAAQCTIDPYSGQQVCRRPHAGAQVIAEAPASADSDVARRAAHCRITVGDGSAGSGTLVARNDRAGLVLTCSHLFDDSTSDVWVMFANGSRYAARVQERDAAHDLAALVIQRPAVEPIDVAWSDRPASGVLAACGYGSNATLRCVRGEVAGQATPVGARYPSITIRARVRSGDSGGGVFSAEGLLVGVIWGERDGLTYVACGAPLRALLTRVLGDEAPRAGGNAPFAGETPGEAREELAQARDGRAEILGRLAALEQQTSALARAKQDAGDYVTRTELEGAIQAEVGAVVQTGDFVRRTEMAEFARRAEIEEEQTKVRSRIATLGALAQELRTKLAGIAARVERARSIAPLIVAAAGCAGPIAVGLVVAFRWGRGRLATRRSRSPTPVPRVSRVEGADRSEAAVHPIAIDTPPPPQQRVTETHYVPIETDSFARAHGWASEQVARKYPGATEVLQAQSSLINQYLAGAK